MDKLKVKLEYCYGIGKLEHEFNLKRSNGCIIYAQNGTMKTSFAKTFEDLSNGKKPKDRIYPDRNTICNVFKDDEVKLSEDEIFVIKPFDEGIRFSKYNDTSLLVNRELRNRYLQIYKDIDEKKKALLKELSKISGIKKNIEKYICEAFKEDFFETIEFIYEHIQDFNTSEYEKLPKYKELFDDKALNDIKSLTDISLLDKYISKYNELLEKSKYLKKGVFNHTNADKVGNALDVNGFFRANHSINLKEANGSIVINNKDELNKIINKEKERILNNEELKKIFNEIDAALTKNKNTEKLRELLEQNPNVASFYNDIENFKKNIWFTYFKHAEESFNQLMDMYYAGKKDIQKIINMAKSQETEWNEVLKIFKRRFSVPFDMEIKNKNDVILKEESPSIDFFYKERDIKNETKIEEDLLLECLSTGEKRALYILNMIYELKKREKTGKEVLLIIDDIADSFDYRNKYAIIEYLKEIKDSGKFKMIILTHNFDFYKTVAGRLDFSRRDVYMTLRDDEVIKIVEGQYTNNVFNFWKKSLATNNRYLIASIPFVRNIIECLDDVRNGNSHEYNELTSLLHIKERTYEITLENLENIFNSVWRTGIKISNKDKDRKVIDIIFEEAEKIYNETREEVNLENKIILSIASRLYAEMYMISKIRNCSDNITFADGRQTRRLIKEFKKLYSSAFEDIKILEEVNMMTAENIHINSFMYEPILDMGDLYLKNIYSSIKNLYLNTCELSYSLSATGQEKTNDRL